MQPYAKLCLTLCDPWTVACQVLLSMEFPRQEYWSGFPFPSPGNGDLSVEFFLTYKCLEPTLNFLTRYS